MPFTPEQEKILELTKENHWDQIKPDSHLTAEIVRNRTIRNDHKITLLTNIFSGEYPLALRRAVYFKYFSLVPLLLQHVSNVNLKSVRQNGKTALHFAAQHGDIETIVRLLEAGAYINILDDQENTPLHEACRNGHVDTAIYLLQRGAFPSPLNKDGNTPFTLLKQTNSTRLSEYLKYQHASARAVLQLPLLADNPQFAWLNSAQTILMQQQDFLHNSQGPRSLRERELFIECISSAGKVSQNKILYVRADDLIAIEKNYHGTSLMQVITTMLTANTDPSSSLLVNMSLEQYHCYVKIVKQCAYLEQLLNTTNIQIVFRTKEVSSDYFFKISCGLDTALNVPAGLDYVTNTNNDYLISAESLTQFLESQTQAVRTEDSAGSLESAAR